MDERDEYEDDDIMDTWMVFMIKFILFQNNNKFILKTHF